MSTTTTSNRETEVAVIGVDDGGRDKRSILALIGRTRAWALMMTLFVVSIMLPAFIMLVVEWWMGGQGQGMDAAAAAADGGGGEEGMMEYM